MRYVIFLCSILIASLKGYAQDSVITGSSKERLKGYRFFFKGESHEFPVENANSLFVLVKHLHTNNNVRYLVMECGPDQAFLANQYLETGNDSLLEASRLYLGKGLWQKLYVFNSQLPAREKIEVLGFDFNRYVYSSKAIKYMFPDNTYFPGNDQLNAVLQEITDWDTVAWDMGRQKDFSKYMDNLRESNVLNDPGVKKRLGKNYAAFEAIINNQSPATPQVKRDRKVIAQLTGQMPGLVKGNFLFNYGIAHVFLDGEGAANILFTNNEFRNQVCSIYPFYSLEKTGSKTLATINKYLPSGFRNELGRYPAYSLVSLEEKKIYPGEFKKAQWILVIK